MVRSDLPGDEGSALLAAEAAELRVQLARAEAAVFEAENAASRARAEAVALRAELAEARAAGGRAQAEALTLGHLLIQ